MNLIQYPVDGRIQRVDKNEKLTLVFKVCDLDDAGTYSVEITEFVKNGERDQTDCWLDVEGEVWVTNLRQTCKNPKSQKYKVYCEFIVFRIAGNGKKN